MLHEERQTEYAGKYFSRYITVWMAVQETMLCGTKKAVVFCTGKDGRWRLLPALLVDEGAPYEAARQLRVVAGAEAVEFPWHGVQSLWVLLRCKGTTIF